MVSASPPEPQTAVAATPAAAAAPAGAAVSTPAVASAAPLVPTTAAATRWRASVGTEVAIWFLCVVLVEHVGFGTGIGFVGVEPSPLWLPILWAALRGGMFPGLAAAGCAGAIHALGYGADAGLDLLTLVAPAVTWPLLVFAGVAFLVGQARDALFADLLRTRRSEATWRAQAESRQRDLDLLQHVNQELKRRIFDRSFDFQTVMSTVARTTATGDEKAFDVPLGMLIDFCGATKCSVLYVLPGGVVDLAAHRGWTDDEIPTRLQAAAHNHRVLRAIVEARPIVALSDEDVQQNGALLVAPLADATGVIKALLCIDEMPPARFDQTTVKTFLGVAAWVANNMRRVEMGGTSEETWQSVMQVLNASKTIGTPEELSERVFLEDARRKRYGVETVLVALRILDVRSSMAEYVETLEGYVTNVLASAVRLTDDVFRFGFAGCYVLVLTGCKTANADEVVARLGGRFSANGDADLGPVDLQLFVVDQEARCLKDLLPRITEHFFGVPIAGLDQRCPVPEPHAQRSGNARDFVSRLRLELDLARRYEMDLNLVDFRGDKQGFGIGPMIARHLWNLVGTLLRVTDGIYVLGPNRCVVLLPCTSCLDATRIWQRLDDALRKSVPEGRYREVQAEFLALAEADARQTLMHLIGAHDAVGQGSVAPILSEIELSELTFSETELASLRGQPAFSGGDGGADAAAVGPRPPSLDRFLQQVAELQRLGASLRDDFGADSSGVAAPPPGDPFRETPTAMPLPDEESPP